MNSCEETRELEQKKSLFEIDNRKAIVSLENNLQKVENMIGVSNNEINKIEKELRNIKEKIQVRKVQLDNKIVDLKKIEVDSRRKYNLNFETYNSFLIQVENFKKEFEKQSEENNERKIESLKKITLLSPKKNTLKINKKKTKPTIVIKLKKGKKNKKK